MDSLTEIEGSMYHSQTNIAVALRRDHLTTGNRNKIQSFPATVFIQPLIQKPSTKSHNAVRPALAKTVNSSAAGPDGMPYGLFKILENTSLR